MRDEKNFVDFVIEAQGNPVLAKDFADAGDAQALMDLFKVYGFTAITEKECHTLAFAKGKIQQLVHDAAYAAEPGVRY